MLRTVASEVTDIDGRLVKLADDMLATMYAEPGIGLAAPQVGVQRRLFVYDVGDGPKTIVNPAITESDGEWSYVEGCLSVPGL
ncbi:MAG: peptide deformylase, partial [Acidimicrobiia bacterium]|nr:peptide deformylase [Acidimicrobiia bacterium]